MSSRTCPDWPELTEVAICCDLDHHVYYGAHTDPQVAEALRDTHWFEVREWSQRGPGSGA